MSPRVLLYYSSLHCLYVISLSLIHFLFQIDKEGASPERVMQELSSIGLMPEDWGGDVPMVQVGIHTFITYMCFTVHIFHGV